ncbi:MAG: AI-2E family transporter [Chloroflexota bacterium]
MDALKSGSRAPLAAIFLATAAFIGFLYVTGLIKNSVLLILIALFVLLPYRKTSPLIQRLITVFIVVFILWLFWMLGGAAVPIVASFILAYLLDPLVGKLEKYAPRWVISFVFILAGVLLIYFAGYLIMPSLAGQLDDAIARLTNLLTTLPKVFTEKKFYDFAQSLGIPRKQMEEIVQTQLLPKLESVFSFTLGSLLGLFNQLSSVVTHLINLIIIPILTFYFLKDFNYLKKLVRALVEKNNPKAVKDLQRISGIMRRWIAWQILAAFIVGTVSSIVFSIFGLPLPVLLGAFAGLVNPIPYLSLAISIGVGTLVVAAMAPQYLLQFAIVIVADVLGLHFINAYFLEPNIAGRQVGLHPVVLILSLFLFGSVFGFLGLLVAIPTTAVLMMYFKDWSFNYLKEAQ